MSKLKLILYCTQISLLTSDKTRDGETAHRQPIHLFDISLTTTTTTRRGGGGGGLGGGGGGGGRGGGGRAAAAAAAAGEEEEKNRARRRGKWGLDMGVSFVTTPMPAAKG